MYFNTVAFQSKCEGIQNKNIFKNNVENKSKTDETSSEIVGDELKINLNDFLDFLNISCHVNDMIRNDILPMSSTNEKVCSKSTTNVGFEALTNNRLVNELQIENGRRKKFTTKLDSNDRMSWRRRTSSVGTSTIGRQEDVRTSGISKRFGLHPKLQEKLDFIIDEGVMDPILPFICPVPMPLSISEKAGVKTKKKMRQRFTETQESGAGNVDIDNVANSTRDSIKLSASNKRKSFASYRSTRSKSGNDKRTETDVVIHVCDEIKNAKRDFYCSQNLLISEMGYFANIVSTQNLTDMDISVHCDIHVFDWLMRWVRQSASRDTTVPSQSCSKIDIMEPILDANNVIPILVSAGFLQMESLISECLAFCHQHLNDLVRASCNLSCLNEVILARLAAMFTNTELEDVHDQKANVTSLLWVQLIQSLCEPEPETLRGHYFSLAGLYRCSKCGKYLTRTMEKSITCLVSNVRMNRWGQLVSYHIRDTTWNISAFIAHAFKEYRSWRAVYWKLWGLCHYFYCIECESYFPAFQMNWCAYHPDGAVFLGPPTEGRSTGPTGRYPCCEKQAFRYETLIRPSGCMLREHSVLLETDHERDIFSTCQLVAENGALYENPPTRFKAMIHKDTTTRWDGNLFVPRRPRLGLLPALNAENSVSTKFTPNSRGGKRNLFPYLQKLCETITGQYIRNQSPPSESSGVSNDNEAEFLVRSTNCDCKLKLHEHLRCSDGGESDDNSHTRKRFFRRKNTIRQPDSVEERYWSEGLSARSNQDNQRDFEEKMMRRVIAIADHKTASDHSLSVQPLPVGGTYVRLEAEWREQLKRTSSQNNSSNNSGGSSSNNINSVTNVSHTKHKNKSKTVERIE